jgi:hypothetical protein
MIAYVKASRRRALLEAFAEKMDAARVAVKARDSAGFSQARDEMLAMADSVERVLGWRNVMQWKPPGQPPGFSIPRPIVSDYLTELGDEPHGPWAGQLHHTVAETLIRAQAGIRDDKRRALKLALFPLYWPFGMAGLILEVLGVLLDASGLVPSRTSSTFLASAAGRAIQSVVTCLELYSFWKLWVAGKLF